MPVLSPELIRQITRGYGLSLDGIHGISHWARVLENGRRLAVETGADPLVIELFAVFHDARRYNDGHDPDHGSRGAALARELLSGDSQVDPHVMDMLEEACRLHTNGLRDADVTIQTCWDADRLDLLRVGTHPRPERLCTEPARKSATLAWANDRAWHRVVPDLIWNEWGLRMPGTNPSGRSIGSEPQRDAR